MTKRAAIAGRPPRFRRRIGERPKRIGEGDLQTSRKPIACRVDTRWGDSICTKT